MNTALLTRRSAGSRHRAGSPGLSTDAAKPRRWASARRAPDSVTIRTATAADAPALHALIEANLEEGHLLPRSLEELSVHAPRFVVAVGDRSTAAGRRFVGCAELAPLSATRRGGALARRRSIGAIARHRPAARRRAADERDPRDGFEKLTRLHARRGVLRPQGFSIVPHVWVPEKIALDCHRCPLFRKCGQHAVVAAAGAGADRCARGTSRRSTAPSTAASPRRAGFRAAGIACGIKASGKPDLALIAADRPVSAAAIFTTNQAKAAPVLVSHEHLTWSGGVAQVIVTNSGCANACTGPQGMADAREMAVLAANGAGCAPAQALVASTGVIGVNLKMDAIRSGVPAAFAALSRDGHADAAQRDHDHGSVSQVVRRRSRRRRAARSASAAWRRAPA